MSENSVRILLGDCRERLAALPSESVHSVITSPPYYGLRDYKTVPGVWGGRHHCEHQWGDKLPLNNNSGLHRMPPNLTGGTKDYSKGRSENRGTVCAKCGAWRGNLGLEPTVAMYVEHMVEVFRAIRRVLRKDGTVWLNMGDSYVSAPPGNKGKRSKADLDGAYHRRGERQLGHGEDMAAIYAKATWREGSARADGKLRGDGISRRNRNGVDAGGSGLKQKDMIAMPWRVGLALQADGWWLRQDIIWHKPNPMPEAIGDRCTKSHEYIFLLAKSATYYYDAGAIAETSNGQTGAAANFARETKDHIIPRQSVAQHRMERKPTSDTGKRNKRSVWTIPTEPFPGSHFAVFPTDLVTPCILAGCPEEVCIKCGSPVIRLTETDYRRHENWYGKKSTKPRHSRGKAGNSYNEPVAHRTVGWQPTCKCDAGTVGGTVLDPFAGAGTVGMVAALFNRSAILIELNPQYVEMAWKRIENELGLQRYKCPVIIDGPVAKVPRYRGKHAKPEATATAQNHPR